MNKKIDLWIVTLYLLASALSLTMLFSISPDRLPQQAISLLAGLVIFIYISSQDSHIFTALAKYAYHLSIFLLLITYLLGETIRGATRWLELGGFQLQTSEIVKPLLALFFAWSLTKYPINNLGNLVRHLVLFAIPFLLVYKQPDLGTALVLLAIFLTQVFVSGVSWLLVGTGGLLAIGLARLSPLFLHDYQLKRLESFINPGLDPLGSGYNVIQSVIAVGSGGLLGKGLGHGTQSHLRFLPERHTDFMFASLSEELGLAGSIFCLVILGGLLYRILDHALQVKNKQDRLVLAGIFGSLLFQTAVNIGMNIGLAPVTGVTLPLISYGGSSILGIALALGVVGAVVRRTAPQGSLEIK